MTEPEAQKATGKRSVLRWMSIFSGGQIAEKFFMFAKILLVASLFGISNQLDAYLVAMIYPTLFLNLLGDAAFIYVLAVFTKYKDNPSQVWQLANIIFTLAIVVCLVLTAAYVASLPWLFHISGFRLEPDTHELAVELAVILSPLLVIYILHNILKALSETFQMFGVSSFMYCVSNGLCITGLVLVGTRWGIRGYAWSTLVSEAAVMLCFLPQLFYRGYRFRPDFRFRHQLLKDTYGYGIGLTLGSGVFKLNVLFNRIIASFLPAGMISVFNYANNFVQVFSSLLRAFANAVFPSLTIASHTQDKTEIRRFMEMALRAIFMVGIPLGAIIFMLREPFIFVLKRGEFDEQAVRLVSDAIAYLTPCIVLFPLIYLEIRMLIVLKMLRVLVILGAAGTLLAAGLSLLLIRTMSVNGLALGNTLGLTISGTIALWLLAREVGGLNMRLLAPALFKGAAAGAACAACIALAAAAAHKFFPGADLVHVGFILVTGGGAGAIGAIATLILLRTGEVLDAIRIVMEKIRT